MVTLTLGETLPSDNRRGLTAADAGPTTAFSPATSGELYEIMARIDATALGASGAATYTVKWIEGGNVITQNVQVTAASTPGTFNQPIQPDGGTSGITYQLSGISGSGTTVNVALSIARMV